MPHIYSRDDNEIASAIEERIHAMRNYKAALRRRRASESAKYTEEIHDHRVHGGQVQQESHAMNQQDDEATRMISGLDAHRNNLLRDTGACLTENHEPAE
ncbi:uncharacterized protein BDW43DRAFT_263211 [Aspergillus alliaceus]|uniref:uncharacterized protein n=1 Tax=Petromyces alliaceus TaxID=209559 RepID=UPI0012A458B0|nr:uncharacterized protein BDW43DRAFT_263211 [Aspergillus alliaceus]KAB8238193.1 hypothetical protein BDW43DRAFT_263211 [Aspergillus alliaceus]